jgi:ADP-ribose pyrophosphatase
VETKDNRLLFKGLVVNVEQMTVKIGGKGWYPYQIVRHSGGVAVMPVHGDGTVTLIRQLRPAVGDFLVELPAGRLSPGEEPEICGRRELLEETGLVAERMESLGFIYPTPGFCDEKIHLFVATGLTQRPAEPEAYEEIETVRLPLAEVRRMAASGDIVDGKTLAVLVRYSGDAP